MKNYIRKVLYLQEFNSNLDKNRFDIKIDLHHSVLENKKEYQRKYPEFINSILNLEAIEHNYHISNNSLLIRKKREELKFYFSDVDYMEDILKLDKKLANFVNLRGSFVDINNNGNYSRGYLEHKIFGKYLNKNFNGGNFSKKLFYDNKTHKNFYFSFDPNFDFLGKVMKPDEVLVSDKLVYGDNTIKSHYLISLLKDYPNISNNVWIYNTIESFNYEIDEENLTLGRQKFFFKRNLLKLHHLLVSYPKVNFKVFFNIFSVNAMNIIEDILLRCHPVFKINKIIL